MAKTKEAKKKTSKKGPGKTGKGGLAPVMHTGIDEDRASAKSGNFAPKAKLKQGETSTYQFPWAPIVGDDTGIFVEIEEHQWSEGKGSKVKWFFVPCAGEGCPLCDDDDKDVAATNYQLYVNVYDFDQKKVVLLKGPKTLTRLILDRYKKNKKEFVRRAWDISRKKASPWWDMERSEDDGLSDKKLKALTPIDAREHIRSEFDQFFGTSSSGGKKKGKNKPSLDADDDGKASALDDDPYTKKSLAKLSEKKLRKIGAAFEIKKVDKLDTDDLIKKILRAQG